MGTVSRMLKVEMSCVVVSLGGVEVVDVCVLNGACCDVGRKEEGWRCFFLCARCNADVVVVGVNIEF